MSFTASLASPNRTLLFVPFHSSGPEIILIIHKTITDQALGFETTTFNPGTAFGMTFIIATSTAPTKIFVAELSPGLHRP